jgi:hypothetical protein
MAAQLRTHGFSLEYDDKNWEAVQGGKSVNPQEVDQAMADRTVAILQRKNADDKYRARVSVVIDPVKKELKGATPLIAYEKHAVDFMKSQRYSIRSEEPIQLPHVKENAMAITATQRDFGLTFRQIIFVKGTNAYLLTATARTDKFASYEKELEGILTSFKWDADKPLN